MPHHNEHNDDRPTDSRPYLVIPYWTDELAPAEPPDNGETRPVPKAITGYLCPGIHASAYVPGTDLTVTVDVRNSGGSNSPSLAQVTVWWDDLTTGLVLDPAKMIGVSVVPIPPRGEYASTPPMTKMIPAAAPPHICLLARVSHQIDFAGVTPKPAADRHWAQRNLTVVTAQPGVPINIAFLAGNPYADEAEFMLQAEIVPEEQYHELADVMGAEPIGLDARLTFSEDGNFSEHEINQAHRIQLGAGEQRRIHLRIDLGDAAPQPGQFVGLQIVQSRGDEPVGSVGVVIEGG